MKKLISDRILVNVIRNVGGVMDKQEIIKKLIDYESELRDMGIEHISLFGSFARNEQSISSDIDLAAIFSNSKRVSLIGRLKIAHFIEGLLGRPVDLIRQPSPKEEVQRSINRDGIDAF